jgi:hypothetical protein
LAEATQRLDQTQTEVENVKRELNELKGGGFYPFTISEITEHLK